MQSLLNRKEENLICTITLLASPLLLEFKIDYRSAEKNPSGTKDTQKAETSINILKKNWFLTSASLTQDFLLQCYAKNMRVHEPRQEYLIKSSDRYLLQHRLSIQSKSNKQKKEHVILFYFRVRAKLIWERIGGRHSWRAEFPASGNSRKCNWEQIISLITFDQINKKHGIKSMMAATW